MNKEIFKDEPGYFFEYRAYPKVLSLIKSTTLFKTNQRHNSNKSHKTLSDRIKTFFLSKDKFCSLKKGEMTFFPRIICISEGSFNRAVLFTMNDTYTYLFSL